MEHSTEVLGEIVGPGGVDRAKIISKNLMLFNIANSVSGRSRPIATAVQHGRKGEGDPSNSGDFLSGAAR